MRRITLFSFLFLLVLAISSCESKEARRQRDAREEKQNIQMVEQQQRENIKLENERIEQKAQLEKLYQERAIYDEYIDNSLQSGAMPYAYCFGENKSCSSYGCSEIKVKTPYNSDVIVTIKKGDKVFRHVYIEKNSQFSFEIPNGTYQPFFYYGIGWNPDKIMKETDCGTLKGGFVSGEIYGKDEHQTLNNNILSYELILQQHGNFSTKPSNPEEAF